MKKLFAIAALVCAGAGLLTAQTAPVQPQVSRAAEAAKQRAWLNQNCVGCHSNRVKNPADDPVNLESASVDDFLANAAMWERVVRKLSVRAMPPPGVRHPADPEYAAFTTWLASSLDRAWAGKVTPGRFVV